MRPIKFICWDKDEKKWIDKFEIDQDGNPGHSGYDGYFEKFDNYILLQFTGLPDKNKNEIYESDIINVSFKSYGRMIEKKFIVVMREKFEFVDEKNILIDEWIRRSGHGQHDGYGMPLENYQIEVIGNINSNPELLENKQC